MYGPRQSTHGESGVIALFCDSCRTDKECIIYGDGSNTRDYVFVKDIARASILALKSKVAGTFNVATGVATSTAAVYEHISRAFLFKKPTKNMPERFGEIAHSVLSAKKIEKVMGWKPSVDFKTGIVQTVEWYKKQQQGNIT